MAQATVRSRLVGDYIVGRQLGTGSFSVVWHGRHRVHGTEVAIKEIAMLRLDKKLQDSLMSEVFILKRINHPNIIRLHEIIEVPGKIHLVLEYCKGGDLSLFIQNREKVPEATAKHFMQQIAAGLQILRDNNLIHRDLKPQNLLLSSNDEKSVLKIADFGFARSLQTKDLAETLCGSPLYMAPEIMQLQKYDAKADLWSVGAILFQLVTGRTPFTGNNQIQLLQNIVKSTELRFLSDNQNLSSDCKDLCQKLLRRNPVERLTFEEFFNHPFLSQKQPEWDESLRNRGPSRLVGGFRLKESDPLGTSEENYQEECLPFFLDNYSSGIEGSPLFSRKKSSIKSIYGFDVNAKLDKTDSASITFDDTNFTSRSGSVTHQPENTEMRLDSHKTSQKNLTDPLESLEQRLANTDLLENIEQDYVFVSKPPVDASVSFLKPSHFPYRSGSLSIDSSNIITRLSAPMPIIGVASSSACQIKSLESLQSAPGVSHGSTDSGDEQTSVDCMTRIKSLRQCAFAIMELVEEKIKAGKQLEAFSIQLVILAIWKQALHICHTQAASSMEGSPNQETTGYRSSTGKQDCPHSEKSLDRNTQGPKGILSQIEGEFLRDFERAEELAKAVEPGNTEMPDAMETIFQSALAFGRNGGVEELMGKTESAAGFYSKAVCLLVFLLVEAPSLILNPPFSLTNSDRYRLRNYIDILNNRQRFFFTPHLTE